MGCVERVIVLIEIVVIVVILQPVVLILKNYGKANQCLLKFMMIKVD